jgi:hypothetical protein
VDVEQSTKYRAGTKQLQAVSAELELVQLQRHHLPSLAGCVLGQKLSSTSLSNSCGPRYGRALKIIIPNYYW